MFEKCGEDYRYKNDLIRGECLAEINEFLQDPNNPLAQGLWEIVEKYGGVAKINQEAIEARKLINLFDRLGRVKREYINDLLCLAEWRNNGKFISMPEYREKILDREKILGKVFDERKAVTLEISAFQYFPWLIKEARIAILNWELMPGRFIRVRNMKEQEKDGDLLAVAAAMQIIGASWVETLDTKGTDGSNIHLDMKNPMATLTGFFGGIGQPNDYVFKWSDELLYYYTNYGVKEVLNFNLGTILAGFWLYNWGIDIGFKISVYAGIDNPFSAFAILLLAKLFSRDDGTTPLKGFNLSNSVNPNTIRQVALTRKKLGLEDKVRIEHHIVETWKGIVRQPYDRLDDLIDLVLAEDVPNISAKHEGAGPEVDSRIAHPSDILDYFREKIEILKSGQMPFLKRNYIHKHDAVQRTAEALTKVGIPVIAAELHSKK
jgi:hypothetical protein